MESNWKQILSDILKKIGIIPRDFTGKISINLTQGSVGDVEKIERLK